MTLALIRALCLAVALAAPAVAYAQTLQPRQLAPAIAAVVEGKIEERAMMLGCAAAHPRLRDVVPRAWSEMRRTLAALLWAADFPAAHVNAMATRTDPAKLDPAPAGAADICATPGFALRAADFSAESWAGDLRTMFRNLGLPADATGPGDGQSAKIREIVARNRPAQARMLACLAVTQPDVLPLAMMDWAKNVGDVRALLQARGFPRDDLASLLDPLEPAALLSLPTDRKAARDSCEKDDSWKTRHGAFMAGAIVGDVREIVTGKR